MQEVFVWINPRKQQLGHIFNSKKLTDITIQNNGTSLQPHQQFTIPTAAVVPHLSLYLSSDILIILIYVSLSTSAGKHLSSFLY